MLVGVAGCAIGIGISACGGSEQKEIQMTAPEYVFTYAENQAEDYPTTLGAYRSAELVKERT